jgi:hypothetical protein
MGKPINAPSSSGLLEAAKTACAELHPQLAMIVDSDKLVRLAESAADNVGRARTIRGQLRSIGLLNRWLQMYYP